MEVIYITVIKFSHKYTKMPLNVGNGSTVRLIEVINSKFEELHKSFIDYDTKVYNGGFYNLPKSGDCLILLFIGKGLAFDTGELFTTVRPSTPAKKKYYNSLCGKELTVKITGVKYD